MKVLLLIVAASLPWTVDAVDGGLARVETRLGMVTVPVPPWVKEGMTTRPWDAGAVRDRLPRGPEGDLDL